MNPIRAWNRFWFAPISARPLGMFRVVIGTLALLNVAFLTVDMDYWLTSLGMMRGIEPRELAGPLRPSLLQWIQDPLFVRCFLACHAAFLVCFTLGWHTRLFGVLVYLTQLTIHQRNVASASGADVLLMVSLFYLMLSPCGAAYSLDARRERKRRGTDAEPIICPWAQRLIQIQLTFMYMITSVVKCAGTTWLTGTALHYVVVNREIGRFDVGWLAEYPVLINIGTIWALAVEFCLAFLLWVKSARPYVIACGVALHVGILFFVNIPLFGELSMACYLVFIDSSEWASIRRALNFRSRSSKPRTPEAKLDRNRRVDRPEPIVRGRHDKRDIAVSTSKAWKSERSRER